eukprot:m.9664 g.9664  ORF g.9664 m.9664 type:complete len:135 (-) comp9474_c0_seq2:215-619(-)
MSSFRSVISTALRGAAARNTAKASSMNRAKQNLFGGRKLLTGVKSGDDKKSPNKSPRTWKPNVFSKNYTSEILSRKISVKVTAYTIRCIDKAGGFDNYILKTKVLCHVTSLCLFAFMKLGFATCSDSSPLLCVA